MDTLKLSNGVWTLVLSEDGKLLSLTDGKNELVRGDHAPAICDLVLGESNESKAVPSATLVRHDDTSAAFDCIVELRKQLHLHFEWSIGSQDESGTPLTCGVEISSAAILDSDVLLRWNWNVQLPFQKRLLFAPLFDGRGLRSLAQKRQAWHYECAGDWGLQETDRLAIPLLDDYSHESTLHITHFADPFFSTGLVVPLLDSPGAFACKFLHAVGSQQFQRRIFGLYLHNGDADTALRSYFDYAIPNCPQGPAWLHEIAMVDYDYLSKKGLGWYRDIDKLSELIAPADRHRVVMTLHGWYDLLGHYSYDDSTKKLLSEWITMPGRDKLRMTPADMHRRIAYAKERGFRVILYFADGTAIDSGSPNYSEEIVFREPDGQLRKHHWGGPDTIAQTYVMNPVHPKVQEFFRGYLMALLDEFGNEIDGLNWDETFTTKVGDISTGQYAGYAERTFMLLCKELRDMIKAHNPEIAFMASDCTGLALPQEDNSFWRAHPAQNALVFDGTFQDSQFYPTAWQYGLFPNYRNVLWSCNWKPLENFDWTNTGVRIFGVPVPISNGWAEDKGISDCTEAEVKKIMQLFEFRKNLVGRIHWLKATDES
ncbi:MAG: hypothetical protein AABZ61_07125 [Bacteroidota bacterium]